MNYSLKIFLGCLAASAGAHYALLSFSVARAEITPQLRFGRNAITLIAPPIIAQKATEKINAENVPDEKNEIVEKIRDDKTEQIIAEKISPKISRKEVLPTENTLSEGIRTSAKIADGFLLEYPYHSRLNNEEGAVTCLVAITREGVAEKVVVVKSSGFAQLDAAAVTAFKRVKYLPAKIDGKIIASQQEFSVKFQLSD